MALVPLRSIEVARAGVKRIFGWVVRHAVNVAANDRVVGIAKRRARRASAPGAVIPVVGILPEGVGDFHGLAVVGGVVDVDRRRAADHIAVIPPHEHFWTVHIPRVFAREAVEVPAGPVGVLGRMWDVVAAVYILHRDLFVRFQVVRAEVQLRESAEENISILQNAAKQDVACVGKRYAARPGAAVVFREEHFAVRKTEGLVVALRVNKQTGRLRAIPEVIR